MRLFSKLIYFTLELTGPLYWISEYLYYTHPRKIACQSSNLTRGLMANRRISQNVQLFCEYKQPLSRYQIENNITLT